MRRESSPIRAAPNETCLCHGIALKDAILELPFVPRGERGNAPVVRRGGQFSDGDRFLVPQLDPHQSCLSFKYLGCIITAKYDDWLVVLENYGRPGRSGIGCHGSWYGRGQTHGYPEHSFRRYSRPSSFFYCRHGWLPPSLARR